MSVIKLVASSDEQTHPSGAAELTGQDPQLAESSAAGFSRVTWIHPHQVLPTRGIRTFQSHNRHLNWRDFYQSFPQRFRGRERVNRASILHQCYSWPPQKSKSWDTSPCQIPYFPSDLPSASTEQITPEAQGLSICKGSMPGISIHHFTMTTLKIVSLFTQIVFEIINPRILLLKFIKHFFVCITHILHRCYYFKGSHFWHIIQYFGLKSNKQSIKPLEISKSLPEFLSLITLGSTIWDFFHSKND